METETSKNKRGRVFVGVIMGFAVGFLVGYITGIRTSTLQLIWIIVGLVCILVIGIGLYSLLRSRKKKE